MRLYEAQSRGPRAFCLRFTTRVTPSPCKTRFQPAGTALTGQDLDMRGSILEFQGDRLRPPFPSSQASLAHKSRNAVGRDCRSVNRTPAISRASCHGLVMSEAHHTRKKAG